MDEDRKTLHHDDSSPHDDSPPAHDISRNPRPHIVKPSLKHPDDPKPTTSDQIPKSFRWDEKTIAEQDLERGTRQKVDEPKTPYVGPAADPSLPELEQSGSFSLDGNVGDNEKYRAALMSALLEAKEKEEKGQPAFWDASSDADEDAEKRHREFEEKRRKHYQMFK